MKYLIIAAAISVSACTTIPDGTCSGYERGRLQGLEIGTQINPARAGKVSAEIEALTLECR